MAYIPILYLRNRHVQVRRSKNSQDVANSWRAFDSQTSRLHWYCNSCLLQSWDILRVTKAIRPSGSSPLLLCSCSSVILHKTLTPILAGVCRRNMTPHLGSCWRGVFCCWTGATHCLFWGTVARWQSSWCGLSSLWSAWLA